MDARPVAAGSRPARAARSARLDYRHLVPSLAYVRIDHANGGIIRNLSGSGIGLQAVGPLHAGQIVHLRFELLKPRIRVEATAQVSWAQESGQAGLRFTEISARTRRMLRDWVFTDLLAAARDLGPRGMFAAIAGQNQAVEDGLLMSAPPFVPIRLQPPDSQQAPDPAAPPAGIENAAEMPVRLPWWPMDIPPVFLALFIDALIVCSSVLLFAVISVAMTGIFPPWTIALLIGAGVTLVFVLLYRYLFVALGGSTVGRQLAQLASEDMHWLAKPEENAPRFR